MSGRAPDTPGAPETIEEPPAGTGEAGKEVGQRLWRNRNYNVLWVSLLFSMMSTELVSIAFPLLVIAHAGSAAEIGLVAATLAVTRMAASIPAGIIADRWNRKFLMLLAQAMRVLSAAGLTAALFAGAPYGPYMFIAAAAEGIFGSVFEPAEHAVLPLVVEGPQLQTAIATNTARPFVAVLLGPAVAGLMFAVRPYAPILLDAGLLAASFFALAVLRLPHRPNPGHRAGAGRGEPAPGEATAEATVSRGFRWILKHPVIRSTVVWMVFVNLAFNALVVIIIAVSGEDRVASGGIGLMMACLGAGGIVGAIAAEPLGRLLRAPVIIIGATWVIAVMAAVMIVTPKGIPLGVVLGAAIVFAPVANTVIMTYQLTIAPADLRGRLSGIVGFCSDGAAVLGPMAGGFLVASTKGGPRASRSAPPRSGWSP